MNNLTMNRSTPPTAASRRADDKPSPADNPKNVVNSVMKAFAVLHAFRAERPAMTVSEIAAAADLDRGTAFRLIHTLVALGYLSAAPVRKYRLTLKCLELGFMALSSHDLWAHAQPLLEACVPELADAASLGVLDGADVLYLQRVDKGLARHTVDRRPGRRIRAYGAALGHAMLAFLPEAEQIRILESAERVKLSDRTLTELGDLMQRLREVRQRGYAVSDGENAYGLRTVAVPVCDAAGVPVAGISLTIDASRMSIEQLVATATPRALAIASELSRALRFSGGAIAVNVPK
jgi:IclR family pca regulon transcriptional regulator